MEKSFCRTTKTCPYIFRRWFEKTYFTANDIRGSIFSVISCCEVTILIFSSRHDTFVNIDEAHFSTPRMNDPTRNRVARLISTRIIMHNLIFWNYIRFDKVRDLKYIFKRELITFQFIEHIIIKSCNVTLPNVSLIKATWQ